jgi:hypothetical protein
MIGPISLPIPFTQLKHPFGKGDLSIISIKIRLLTGEYSLGFNMIGQPAPIADAILVKV